MDLPTARQTIKVLEARLTQIERQLEEDATTLRAMIDMKTDYVKSQFKAIRRVIPLPSSPPRPLDPHCGRSLWGS